MFSPFPTIMNQTSRSSLLRYVGYGLLILSLFDLIDSLVPLSLLDPLWQFQTVGQFVEGVPILIIGLVLVFYGARNKITKWEKPLLNIVSWAALLVGIGYLLFVPLGVFSSFRIDQSIDNQVAQNLTQTREIKEQLKQVNTEKLTNQLKQTYSERRLQLLKQSVKWNLGSLVSGVLFIIIWQLTDWARSLEMRE
jgi:hypothetical protein